MTEPIVSEINLNYNVELSNGFKKVSTIFLRKNKISLFDSLAFNSKKE